MRDRDDRPTTQRDRALRASDVHTQAQNLSALAAEIARRPELPVGTPIACAFADLSGPSLPEIVADLTRDRIHLVVPARFGEVPDDFVESLRD